MMQQVLEKRKSMVSSLAFDAVSLNRELGDKESHRGHIKVELRCFGAVTALSCPEGV